MAIVGGLGLAGTMGLNVMERTREIGVMRSIGASNLAVALIVLTEGGIIAVVSWLIAIPMSAPFTLLFDVVIGQSFFERNLVFSYQAVWAFIWLFIVLFISLLASFVPARTAVNMSVRDTLAYE